MTERNDQRYTEFTAVAFAIYCDEHDLTLDEGRELAARIGDELESTAGDRQSYLAGAG
jgi:hypothetical protein